MGRNFRKTLAGAALGSLMLGVSACASGGISAPIIGNDNAVPRVSGMGIKTTIYQRIEKNWVRPLPDRVGVDAFEENAERWVDMSIEAMIADLGVDENTRYVPPARWAELVSRGANPPERSNITWRLTGQNFAYFQIGSFDQSTVDDMRGVLRQIEEAGAGVMIMDLRGNTGGLLSACVDLAGLFLDGGDVMTIERRTGSETLRARSGSALPDIPLYVLVDDGTETGAELVATALQARGRAKTVGEITAGLGNLRTVFPLRYRGEESGLFVTTAFMTGPGGIAIDGLGVPIDLELEEGEDALTIAIADATDGAEAIDETVTLDVDEDVERGLLDALNEAIALPEGEETEESQDSPTETEAPDTPEDTATEEDEPQRLEVDEEVEKGLLDALSEAMGLPSQNETEPDTPEEKDDGN